MQFYQVSTEEYGYTENEAFAALLGGSEEGEELERKLERSHQQRCGV